MNKVLRVIKKENQWPGIAGYKVEVEIKIPSKESIKAEIFMSEEQYKIHMFVQELVESDKITEIRANALLNLVEDYAQAKYSEGYGEGAAQEAENSDIRNENNQG